MTPCATPIVVGASLDLNAPEDYVRNLINSPQYPVGKLVVNIVHVINILH